MRIVRTVTGTVLLMFALPMLIAGGVLWESSHHRDPDGAFRAQVEPIRADGSAIVVWDLDSLLRREAAFARGGRTTIEIDAPGRFVGLGPKADVERYLAGAGWLEVDRVRLARGPLPVDANAVGAAVGSPSSAESAGPTESPAPAAAAPRSAPAVTEDGVTADTAGSAATGTAPTGGSAGGAGEVARPRPDAQKFWRQYTTADGYKPLSFAPSTIRGEALSLVIMNADGGSPVDADITVAVIPSWLNQTTWGVLILGTVLLLIAIVMLAWPRSRREVVYVVEPSQLPEFAARFGLPAPTHLPVPPEVAASDTPAEDVSPADVSPADVSPADVSPADGDEDNGPTMEWPPRPSQPRTAPPVPAETHDVS
jgi:hypothetical protein